MTTSMSQVEALTRPLERIRRRVRLLAAVAGITRAIWVALAGILLVGLGDYLFHLPGWVRLVAGVFVAVYFLLALIRNVVRPFFSPFNLDVVAAAVERLDPQLQDRLRSALAFSVSETHGSRTLQAEVINQAIQAMETADISGVTDPRQMRQGILRMAGMLLLSVCLFYWQPVMFHIALDRLLVPLGSMQWPRSVEIRLLKSLPKELPAGQRLDVAVRLLRGDRSDRKVVVSWQLGDGPIQQQLMQRAPDGTFTASVDARPGDQNKLPPLRVSIDAGDDHFGPAVVNLIPRLQVANLTLKIIPPAYCDLSPTDVALRLQSASVPAGSQVELRAEFNKAAKNVRLESVGTDAAPLPAIKWSTLNPQTIAGKWRADQSLRFRILAEDEAGFASHAPEEYEIITRPDQLPVIQLENPRRSEDRTAEATIPLEATMEDDFGIDRLWLEARLIAGEMPTTAPASTQPSVLEMVISRKLVISEAVYTPVAGDLQRHRYHFSYAWKLASFPSSLLKSGDAIEFQLAVRDTFALDGKLHPAVKSPPLRITIVSQELLQQRVYDDLRQIATQISELKSRQDRLQTDTSQLKQDTKDNLAFKPADQAVADRIAEQQQQVSAQAKELASRLANTRQRLDENASPNKELQQAVEAAGKTMDKASESSMRPAAQQVKQASESKSSKDQRNNALDETSRLQKQASEQLNQALEQLGDLGGLQRAIDIVQDLLNKQKDISKQANDFARDHAGVRPENLKPEDREKLGDMSRQQGELANKTDRALDQLQNMSQRQQSSDPSGAQAMKHAAQSGREQSVSQSQRSASSAMSQNQSSQASSSQANAESALQSMLQDLKQAQQHKLEELIRKLANLEDQIKTLIRRQAGHNLDNLLLQDPKLAEGPGAELAKLLVTKSGRKELQAAGTTIDQLSSSQQQTHRNTSDMSADVDKIKGGSEASAHLNRAAGRMERAIASLKQGQLKEALQPPQNEALAELELALKQVEELHRQAQQQSRKHKQDELRREYELVRAQQAQIHDVTKLLHQALAGDTKRRGDLVRLAQLAGDQHKLADKIKSLGEQLAQLGSYVFIRVNDGVAADMTQVSQQLSGQKTGKPTQFQQTQIIARLDAIIRGLTPVPPEESKYESRSSSGGSGSGGSKRKLPTAAELQLIKDLQLLVNSGTQGSGKEDQDILSELSQQQGGLRTTLDQLLRKVVGDDVKLPDANESRQQVPEESADPVKAETEDFDKALLGDAPAGDEKTKDMPDVRLLARRMTRSQLRLGESHDPGQTTQLVQKKIVQSLDRLIAEAKSSQSQQSSSSQQGEAQQQGKADSNSSASSEGSKSEGGATPAGSSTVGKAGQPPVASGDIRETAKEWGGISQRDRQAIIESAGENIVEKYRLLTEEYYKALSVKASQKP